MRPYPYNRFRNLARNPSFATIQNNLRRVRREMGRICSKMQCDPVVCNDIDACQVRPSRRNPFKRNRYRRPPWFRTRRRKRNPLRRFSRPLSAGLARTWMGEDVYPEATPEIHRHRILIVGGDASYVPVWMQQFSIVQLTQVDIDLDAQLDGFEPDLILMFVKAPKPLRPSQHTIYKVKNYSKGDNIRKRYVPYITVHKGWSHVIQRASELGLDWFTDAYPHQIYIPEEDLTPIPPARKQTKARLAHNLKRGERFAAKGITSDDVRYAHARYVSEHPNECCLCDTKIKYQFRLMFDRPGEPEPVIFHPVGSTCITDWVDALPDSEGKLEFLHNLKKELEKVEKIQSGRKGVAAERRKKVRQEQGLRIREREAERKKKLAARKEQRKREREARRPTTRSKAARKAQEPPPLSGRIQQKMEDAQMMFDWDDED